MAWRGRRAVRSRRASLISRGCFSSQTELGGFQIEKQALPGKAAAESHQFPRRPDDAMAGHDDRDGIAAVGGADGAHRPRRADLFGEAAVAPGFSIRNVAQFLPDALLKSGAVDFERKVESTEIAGEIKSKL